MFHQYNTSLVVQLCKVRHSIFPCTPHKKSIELYG